jgi:hypothetical protein
MPSLCELYPGICLTTEEKARKNLSHGGKFGIDKGAQPPSSPHRAAIERDAPFMESNQLECRSSCASEMINYESTIRMCPPFPKSILGPMTGTLTLCN